MPYLLNHSQLHLPLLQVQLAAPQTVQHPLQKQLHQQTFLQDMSTQYQVLGYLWVTATVFHLIQHQLTKL